ncbi:haloacid dehalogenase [Pueribacillus theae]|uniref:Phosphoserine phosphatase n=1 Tax=Pueribacillus theae TaxID=2171751 RepID=A0A2U1K439_9BACI|nr:HAD family hydrolase [Pueribacillus theae]PWA12172.1 haloacid dehalogenase [Pueribacillus theae]
MIKAVMFDLDDTLLWDDRSINEAFEETCAAAAKKYELDPKKLEESVKKEARELYSTYETFEFTKMIGINPFEGLWGNFLDDTDDFRKLNQVVPAYRKDAWTNGLKALGIDDKELGAKLGELFPKIRRQKKYVYDETYAILDSLNDNYKLLLLTNGSPDLQNEKLRGVPELSPYFDHIIISGSFGRGKPDKGLFQHALEKLGVANNEAIMVGDKLTTDILGANQAGITSVWINRNNLTRSDDIIPDYEIQSLNEIPSIIEAVNKASKA